MGSQVSAAAIEVLKRFGNKHAEIINELEPLTKRKEEEYFYIRKWMKRLNITEEDLE